jgi:hypothetical protein
MRAIQNDPLYLVGREAGLFLAKPDDLLTGEEAFLESYIPQLGKLFPPLKWGVNASERAYTGFLNELRFRTFKNLVKNAKDAGNEVFTVTTDEEGGHHIVPTEVTENLAKYINVSTGRGSLGRFDKISQELNTFIWSPKLLSSRLTMLNPKYYQNLDPFTKQEALKTLLAITGFGIVTGTLGALIGGKTLGNPLTGFLKTKRLSDMNWFTGTEPQMLSTDFGKSRFGENVVDPWAGFQQVIVATARFIAGEANGKPQTRAETVGNFTVNKLSPMAALAYEIGSAKKFTGKGQFEDKYGQKKYLPAEVANSFVPMFVQDLITVFKTHPGLATQIGLDLASLTGMGVQNYPEARTQQNRQKMKFRKPSL